jgi:murein DD-endopeptidase MepM/ murein hydrolase activator NlpD
VAAHDIEPDHAADRGLPSIGDALTQRRRAAAGWIALAGNDLSIESGGVVAALCHLQQGSISPRPGRRVCVGDVLARCGSSGNSTGPHVHLQVNDSTDVVHADAVPLAFRGSLPEIGEVVDAGTGRRAG